MTGVQTCALPIYRPFMGEVVQALKLVCNEFNETQDIGSKTCSQDDVLIDVDSKARTRSGEITCWYTCAFIWSADYKFIWTISSCTILKFILPFLKYFLFLIFFFFKVQKHANNMWTFVLENYSWRQPIFTTPECYLKLFVCKISLCYLKTIFKIFLKKR